MRTQLPTYVLQRKFLLDESRPIEIAKGREYYVIGDVLYCNPKGGGWSPSYWLDHIPPIAKRFRGKDGQLFFAMRDRRERFQSLRHRCSSIASIAHYMREIREVGHIFLFVENVDAEPAELQTQMEERVRYVTEKLVRSRSSHKMKYRRGIIRTYREKLKLLCGAFDLEYKEPVSEELRLKLNRKEVVRKLNGECTDVDTAGYDFWGISYF